MSATDFRKYWIEGHAEVAKKLPGLRSYYILPFDIEMDSTTGRWQDGEPSEDGIAMLWFDDRSAADAAFSSPQGSGDVAEFNESPITSLTFGGEVVVIVE